MAAGEPITGLARQGETLAALVWRLVGRTRGVVERVLDANPQLAGLGPRLPAGTPVVVPAEAVAATPVEAVFQLWD